VSLEGKGRPLAGGLLHFGVVTQGPECPVASLRSVRVVISFTLLPTKIYASHTQ
jgi:hypothetical protein